MKTIEISEIKAGDLLIWSNYPQNFFSGLVIRIIAFLTGSNYGHVGIAWRVDGRLSSSIFCIEATVPSITVSAVDVGGKTELYCIPVEGSWTLDSKDFIFSKIGLSYGFMDAVRAYFGLVTKDDNQYQCAELAHEFYEKAGIFLPKQLTPNKIVENLQTVYGKQLYRVVKGSAVSDQNKGV